MVRGPKTKITQGVVTDQGLTITQNASSQVAVFIQNAATTGVQVSQNAQGSALRVSQNSNANAIEVSKASGDQDAVYVAHAGGATAIQGDMTGGGGNALRATVQSASTASCAFFWNRNATNTSVVLSLENDSTTSGNTIQMTHSGTGDCIELNPTANAVCMDINKTNTGNANVIDLLNSGTGNAIQVTQGGNGTALSITKSNTGSANVIAVSNSGSGNALQLTAAQANINAATIRIDRNATTDPHSLMFGTGGTYNYAIGRNGSSDDLVFGRVDGAGTFSEYVRFDTSGRVGIGTTPSQVLHVKSTDTGSILYERTPANADIQYTFRRSDGSGDADMYVTYWGQGDRNTLALTNGGGSGLHLTTSGNIVVNDFTSTDYDNSSEFKVVNRTSSVTQEIIKTHTGSANVINITNSADASASSFDIKGNGSLWHFAANGRARIAVAGSAVKNALNGWATLSGPTKWQTVAMSSAQGAAVLDNAYFGATFDGQYIYYAPANSDTFISYDTQQPFTYIAAWQQLAMSSGQNGAAVDNGYQGCIFDGRYLYFTAFNSDTFVRYDTSSFFTSTSSWTQMPMNSAQGAAALDSAYVGASCDGQYIYFVPFDSTTFIRYQTTQDFTAITSWSKVSATTALGGNATVAGGFENATFDGRYIYYAPKNSDTFVRFDTSGTFTSSASWEQIQMNSAQNGAAVDNAYAGAVFDGRYVYYGARDSDTFVRFDTTGSFTAVSSWSQMPMNSAQGAAALDSAYFSTTFDGRYIYYTAFNSDTFIRFDTTLSFTAIASWEQIAMSSAQGAAAVDSAYAGIAFDGRYVYHSAVNSDTFVRFAAMNSAPLGPTEYAQVST